MHIELLDEVLRQSRGSTSMRWGSRSRRSSKSSWASSKLRKLYCAVAAAFDTHSLPGNCAAKLCNAAKGIAVTGTTLANQHHRRGPGQDSSRDASVFLVKCMVPQRTIQQIWRRVCVARRSCRSELSACTQVNEQPLPDAGTCMQLPAHADASLCRM